METGGRVRRTCLDSTGFRDSKQIGVHKCCKKVTNPVKEVSKDDFKLRVDCVFLTARMASRISCSPIVQIDPPKGFNIVEYP